MARTIKLKRKVSGNKGKDAYDIDKNKKRIMPGEGGALDPVNDPLLKDDEGYYTLKTTPKTKAGRGGKYNLKQRGKSAR